MSGIQGAINPISNQNYIWNTSTLAWEKATGSLTGGGVVTVNNFPATQTVYDPYGDGTAKYKLSDLDTASSPSYYGYMDIDGAWYIMKLDTASGTARYAKGGSDYATSWTGRVGLSYGYYDATF